MLQQQENLGRGFGAKEVRFGPLVAWAAVCSKTAVLLLLFIVTPIVGVCGCSMVLLCVALYPF